MAVRSVKKSSGALQEADELPAPRSREGLHSVPNERNRQGPRVLGLIFLSSARDEA